MIWHGTRAVTDTLTAITDFYTTVDRRPHPLAVREGDLAAAILALRPGRPGRPDADTQPARAGSRTEA